MAYIDRDTLKGALSLPASATDKHWLLDAALDGVTQEIDKDVGYGFAPRTGTRYYRPTNSDYLVLDYPLTAVTSVTLDNDEDGVYESTLAATAYYLLPDNATEQSPAQPFWALEIRADANASAVFPVGVRRGVKITGTWGYYDQRTETTAKPATGISAAANVWDMVGASGLRAGQMLRVDDEQVLILDNALSGSATAAASGQITVRRAQGGTTGATHSSNSTMSVYSYPIIERTCLYQAEMDYRAMDAPLGVAGGDYGGGQTVRAPGGLHPFSKKMLDQFREPVAR